MLRSARCIFANHRLAPRGVVAGSVLVLLLSLKQKSLGTWQFYLGGRTGGPLSSVERCEHSQYIFCPSRGTLRKWELPTEFQCQGRGVKNDCGSYPSAYFMASPCGGPLLFDPCLSLWGKNGRVGLFRDPKGTQNQHRFVFCVSFPTKNDSDSKKDEQPHLQIPFGDFTACRVRPWLHQLHRWCPEAQNGS